MAVKPLSAVSWVLLPLQPVRDPSHILLASGIGQLPGLETHGPHPPSLHDCHLIGTPVILDQGPPCCSRVTSCKLSTSVMALSPDKAPFWPLEVWIWAYFGGMPPTVLSFCRPFAIAAGILPSRFSSGKVGAEQKEPASLWLLCFLETYRQSCQT